MPDNKTLVAFDDVRKLMDKALDSARGIKIICRTHSDAIVLRRRCNTYRKRDRYENAQVYPEGNPMHKRSVYDQLQLRVPPKGGEICLIIEKIEAIEYEIEILEEITNEEGRRG